LALDAGGQDREVLRALDQAQQPQDRAQQVVVRGGAAGAEAGGVAGGQLGRFEEQLGDQLRAQPHAGREERSAG
jgi:hypothetical protein